MSDNMTDAEKLERFRVAYDEMKQAYDNLPSVTANDQRRDLWKTILTRQTEIESLYPAQVDPL